MEVLFGTTYEEHWCWTVVAACALFIYMSLTTPAYARAHPHLDPAMLAAYASPWAVALGCGLSVMGIMLALIPIRRGEAWALWTSLITLTILLITRVATDPRCLVMLDPHQHGRHTFMIAIAVRDLVKVLPCGA